MKNLDDKMERITGVKSVREKVDKLENKVEERSFAYDLLCEFKSLNKRLFIIIVILIATLVGSNMAWLYVFQSYDYATYEYQQDGEGYNNINHDIGGSVNNNNGAETENQNPKQAE